MGRRATWLVATTMVLTAASTVTAGASTSYTVQMHEFKFILPSGDDNYTTPLKIKVGDKVTITWGESATDPMPNCDTFSPLPPPFPTGACPGHSATAAEKGSNGNRLFDSGLCLPPDGRPSQDASCPMTVTFDRAGTYHYYCVIHGGRAFGNSPNQPLTNMDGTIEVTGAGGGPLVSEKSGSNVTVGLPSAGRALDVVGESPEPISIALAIAIGGALLAGVGVAQNRRCGHRGTRPG